MRTEQQMMPELEPQSFDDPTVRLRWTLPCALVIWVFLMFGFNFSLKDSSPNFLQPTEMQAELIEELPPPPVVSHQRDSQPTPSSSSGPNLNPPNPQSSSLATQSTASQITQPSAEPILPASAPQSNTDQPNNSASSFGAQSAARALVQPMPQIPDSLREEALQAQAIARFTIGVDGVVTVDWLRPTQNPVLNRLLLASLKNWKFFPALKDGKPVASTQDIVIKIQVK